MVVLSAAFTTLFLSPFLFFLLLAAAAVLVALHRRKAALWLTSATAVALLAFSMAPVGNLLMRPLESRYPPFPADPPRVGAIVVLGAGVEGGAPDEGGGAALSEEAVKRVVYGLRLYRGLGVPIVLSGGRVWNTGEETEADAAATLLARLGVPDAVLVREGRSRTTWENARNVAAILAELKIARVALVTSAYHMPRAMIAFDRAGVSCVAAPTDYRSYGGKMTFADVLPRFASLEAFFSAVREYVGIIQYRARR
jgi:uncharacterized SAM-binding protein YcdF (DUF218 family)